MTMTEIRGRVRLEMQDKRLADAVLSHLAYRAPRRICIEDGERECPVCGHEFTSVEKITAYCPDCGQELAYEQE